MTARQGKAIGQATCDEDTAHIQLEGSLGTLLIVLVIEVKW
jgi:hypothetical protein